jgi:hypothetical protein
MSMPESPAQPTTPIAPPPSGPWASPEQWYPPPAWAAPARPPRPKANVSWPVLIGGILILFGYLLFVAADLAFLGMPQNPTYQQYVTVASLYIAGEAILGVGFLVALIGLAIRR